MNIANFKTALVTLTILVTSFFSAMLYADCEMMAMIAKKGHYISWQNQETGIWDDPYDFYQFMRDESYHTGTDPNDDGYGIVFYDENKTIYFNENDYYDGLNQAWYLTNRDTLEIWQENNAWYADTLAHYQWFYDEPLDSYAVPKIMNNSSKATIVLGHDRNGTGGSGNHPFRLEVNGTHYTFEHNGNVGSYKDDFYAAINTLNWSSNWEGVDHPDSLSTWIDSELYFHYIVANIENYNGDVIQGIYNALDNVGILGSDVAANFILSDGSNVYAYKGTNVADYNLSYKDFGNYWGIVSETDLVNEISRYNLAIFTPYGDNFKIIDLTSPYPDYFVSGIIGNSTWSQPHFITDDVIVPYGVTLNIDCIVDFYTHCNFIIYGTVNLLDDSEFNLNYASEVLIDDDGILELAWGCEITGAIPTTIGATQPGYPSGGEEVVPGDRIIAKNGGVITTDILDNFTSDCDSITIASTGSELWDGIFIQNPGDEDDFWFVNCDIQGISKLSIENVGLSGGNTAYLNLHYSDFHDAGQIVVRDGHELTIKGSVAEGYCYIQDNIGCPINAYESPVYLDSVWVGGDGHENNGAGLYLYDSSTPMSEISNSKFLNNNGNGVTLNGVSLEFNYSDVEENTGYGMLCYGETEFIGQAPFHYISIIDNGYAEYAGGEDTFNMGNRNANILISDSNYGTGLDQYLLMNFKWNSSEPVDIRGTNITSSDLSHLSPSNLNAWTFGGGITTSREMLISASSDMGYENYSSAEQTLQQIITDYPLTPEAGSAVYYLYHLETLTDQEFTDLRSYLQNISSSENTPLETAIEKIITKTYMKEKDYLIAIDRLETVINNSQIPNEVVSAMIDQGYCYMELAEESERGLPVNCTIKTATLDEYQAKVRELETQFSFYPEEENQNTATVPSNIVMHANHPNPFNPSTTISFDLVQATDVAVTVYNLKGQKVKTLLNEYMDNGTHSVYWNGKDNAGKSAASGLYFYKLTAGKDTVTKKMLLLK